MNGQLKVICSFTDGKMNGMYKKYDENGNLHGRHKKFESSSYVDGKKLNKN